MYKTPLQLRYHKGSNDRRSTSLSFVFIRNQLYICKIKITSHGNGWTLPQCSVVRHMWSHWVLRGVRSIWRPHSNSNKLKVWGLETRLPVNFKMLKFVETSVSQFRRPEIYREIENPYGISGKVLPFNFGH